MIIHYKFEPDYLDLFIGSEVLSKNFRWAHQISMISQVFSLIVFQSLVQTVTFVLYQYKKYSGPIHFPLTPYISLKRIFAYRFENVFQVVGLLLIN